jgi:hypothetical protein
MRRHPGDATISDTPPFPALSIDKTVGRNNASASDERLRKARRVSIVSALVLMAVIAMARQIS